MMMRRSKKAEEQTVLFILFQTRVNESVSGLAIPTTSCLRPEKYMGRDCCRSYPATTTPPPSTLTQVPRDHQQVARLKFFSRRLPWDFCVTREESGSIGAEVGVAVLVMSATALQSEFPKRPNACCVSPIADNTLVAA